jgi:hypothetical protein
VPEENQILFGLLTFLSMALALPAAITVSEKGEGGDYISGVSIVLPAAKLCTNRFGEGTQPILNRPHQVQAAAFDSAGQLSIAPSAKPVLFPAYLSNNPYIGFLQEVRHYTNYSCTVTVDCPTRFYLLVDNRVNDFAEFSSLDDPSFGPPDTEWITRDGWTRVNTGISPGSGGVSRPDYLCIHEGGIGAIHQFYAIYSRTLPQGGSVTLRTQFEGNVYCLVVGTNGVADVASGPGNAKMDQATAGR